jgi:hypothetical protein
MLDMVLLVVVVGVIAIAALSVVLGLSTWRTNK